jgi:MFS family permease
VNKVVPHQDSSPLAAQAPPHGKLWRVGTLTYTSGGLVALFCWLLWGDFAWSLKDRSVPVVLQLMLRKFEASDMLSGLLIGSLPAVISIILVPVICYKSDRHRGRWGRRIPYLLIPAPIAALAMAGLAFSPMIGTYLHTALGSRSPGLNFSIIFFFGLFWSLFGIASVTANAIFGGLVNDIVPASVIGRFFGMFRALSLIAGVVFNFYMMGNAETHYIGLFLGIGVLYGIGFTLMCMKVKEGEYPPLPPNEGRHVGSLNAVKTYFIECFGNPYYLLFFVVNTLAVTAISPVNLFSVFFAQNISVSMDMYGKCVALTYVISLALAYPLGALADRFHPLRVTLGTVGLYAVISLLGGIFVTGTTTFGIALVAHGVLSGAYLTASASLGQRLFPAGRFAELTSASGILGYVASILIAPVMGIFLDYTHHVYRYTFLVGSALAGLALLAGFVFYRKFMALGGPKYYVPPE